MKNRGDALFQALLAHVRLAMPAKGLQEIPLRQHPISLEVRRAAPELGLVECLEHLLARARTGELHTIAYVVFEADGGSESGNAGQRFNRYFVLGTMAANLLDFYSRQRETDKGERP